VPHTRDQLEALSQDELSTHIRSLHLRVRLLDGPQQRRSEKDLAAVEINANPKLKMDAKGLKTKT
jgi:hypothetical protein